ncbi:MAG: methyl-accepting chemotaxis protein [Coriobacteriia bacterium]|nr:methyl-accepting chemotaxis protein [Coriobacteriia bacterium]
MAKRTSNFKVRTKLMAGFLVVMLIGIALGGTGLYSITTLTKMSEELNLLRVNANSASHVLNAHYSWRQSLTEAVYSQTQFTGTLDPATCSLGTWMDSPEASAIADPEILALLSSARTPHESMHYEAETVMKLVSSDEYERAVFMLNNTVLPDSQEVIELLSKVDVQYDTLINDLMTQIVAQGAFFSMLIIVFIVAAVIAGIVMSLLAPSALVRPLGTLSSVMEKAADSDLTVRLPSDYGAEIGALFDSCNRLLEYNDQNIAHLSEVVTQTRSTAQSMLTISVDMAENSKSLNEQTSSVSTTAEEFSAGMSQSTNALSTASSHISAVASSIEEINSTIGTVAAAAEETSARVNQSSDLVDSIQNSIVKASGSVQLVSDAFNSVAESVDEINKSILLVSEHSANAKTEMSDADIKAKNTNEIIQRLEAASKQIGKIVNVINDIADQTNMLALNAAIEAAGAGEAGKGFMVVANEVKELAKQTADATDEIANHIENMQKNMPEAVGAVIEITAIMNSIREYVNSFAQEMERQEKRSDQINEESAAAARRMNEIATEINHISENAQSVTSTVVESAKGVNEIAKSTAELVIGTQEIAMNSERTSSNISEINRAAKEMTSGIVDISKSIQLISKEAAVTQQSADSAKLSSEELLDMANDMEGFISKFKISD